MKIPRLASSAIALALPIASAFPQTGVAVFVTNDGSVNHVDLGTAAVTVVNYVGIGMADIEVDKSDQTIFLLGQTSIRALDVAAQTSRVVAHGFERAWAMDLVPTGGNADEKNAFVIDRRGLWHVDLGTGAVALETDLIQAGGLSDIEVSPNGRCVYFLSDQPRRVFVWDRQASSLSPLPFLRSSPAAFTSLLVDPGGGFLYATPYPFDNLFVLDLSMPTQWAELSNTVVGPCIKSALSADGVRLYAASIFGTRSFRMLDLTAASASSLPLPPGLFGGFVASTAADTHAYVGGPRVYRLDFATQQYDLVGPEIAADPTQLALRSGSGQGYLWGSGIQSDHLLEVDLGSGASRVVTTTFSGGPIAAPPGESFVYAVKGNDLVRVDADGSDSVLIASWAGAGAADLDVDASGNLLFSRISGQVWLTDIPNQQTTLLVPNQGPGQGIQGMDATADGSAIYLIYTSVNNMQLARYDVSAMNLTPIATLPGGSGIFRLGENDGAAYIYCGGSGSPRGLYRVDLDAAQPQPMLVREYGQLADYVILNTGAGTGVATEPVDPTTGEQPVTLTFDKVTVPGESSVVTSATGPAIPSGFQLGDPATYYEISTSATFAGDVELCIDYSGVSYDDESSLQILHFVNGDWEVVADAQVNPTTQTICGTVSSFSPFAVVEFPVMTELAELRVKVQALNVSHGIVTSLDAKLAAAQLALKGPSSVHRQSAKENLEAFIQETQSQSGKEIPTTVAADLIADARAVLALL